MFLFSKNASFVVSLMSLEPILNSAEFFYHQVCTW